MNERNRNQDRIEGEDVLVSVMISAEPATVWSFFDDASRFASWIGAFGGGAPLPGTRVEPKQGGAIRVCYPGENVAACGTITAMEPRRRLVFSWGYENNHNSISIGSTEVEITLTPQPEGTLVQLRHRGLPSERVRQEHLGGWKHYLSMLAGRAAQGQYSERLAGLWSDYFRAWAEPDETARRELLQDCCEPDICLRTSFACTDGVEALSQHVANALKHMPGMSLQPDGEPQLVHGFTQAGWKIVAPNGRAVMRGSNFARLSLAGRLAAVASFPTAG